MSQATIEEAFYFVLANTSAVSSVTGSVSLYVAPQSASGQIVVITVSDVEVYTSLSRDSPGAAKSTVDVTAYGSDQGQLLDLRKTIRDALHGTSGLLTIGDDSIFIYSLLADYSRPGRIEATDDDDLGLLMFSSSFLSTHSV